MYEDGMMEQCSVTRFGKFSPLWQNFDSLWHFSMAYSVFAKYVIYFGTFLLLSNLHCWTWPNVEQIIQPSGLTVINSTRGRRKNRASKCCPKFQR